MKDDPLSELLTSPLDEMPPGRSRRAWLGFGAGLLVAALAGTGIALWLTRDSGEGATTTAAAAGPTTTAGVGDASSTTTGEDSTTTTTAAPVAGTPEPRVYAQLVATDAGIFLFGGLKPVPRLNADRFDDVWRYDPATGEWWDVQAPRGPVPRAGAAVAYDAGSGLVVLFGGAVGSCNYPYFCSEHIDDTWVYDPTANTWEERAPATSPPGRHGHTMAYDARSDRVVLFGGDTGSAWLGDTWAYDTDGDTWVEVTTDEAPWPVAQQAMAYDPAADRIVLWGGADREESVVWTFDLESATWSAATWDPAPEPAWDACLVWDAAAEQMLLVGGEGPTTVQISAEITAREVRLRDEVWALDPGAGAWALLGRLPEPVARHGCADDPDATGVFVWKDSALLPVDPATGTGMAEE